MRNGENMFRPNTQGGHRLWNSGNSGKSCSTFSSQGKLRENDKYHQISGKTQGIPFYENSLSFPEWIYFNFLNIFDLIFCLTYYTIFFGAFGAQFKSLTAQPSHKKHD